MKKKIIAWGIIVIGIGAAFRTGVNIVELIRAQDRLKLVQSQVEEAQKEDVELQKQIEEAKTEDFVLNEARTKLGLGKPGEVMIVLPREERAGNLQAAAGEPKNLPNWRLWWEKWGI